MRINSLLLCLCSVVMLLLYCAVLYYNILYLCCAVLWFFFSAVHSLCPCQTLCTVHFSQFWTLHFHSSSAWQLFSILLCFFFVSIKFEVFFWTFYFVIASRAIFLLCIFLLRWAPFVTRTIWIHKDLFPCDWEDGPKTVTAGTLSWQSERYRFNNEHSISYSILVIFNTISKVWLESKTKPLGWTKMLGP